MRLGDGLDQKSSSPGVRCWDSLTKSITVDMHNLLRQVPRELQLCKQIVGSPQLPGQIELLQLLLLRENPINLGRQDFVFFLLSVEEL